MKTAKYTQLSLLVLYGFSSVTWMPSGLTNAPAMFQRLMQICHGNMHLQWCIIYLGDIIVFAKTPKEHFIRLRAVFEKLKEAGLTLRLGKCKFFKQSLTYLGHVMSDKGIEMDPKKTEIIQNWPIPKMVMEVSSFLQFTNYCRHFISKYAQVAKPLYHLTSENFFLIRIRTLTG